jgi:F-type H+-transporting ATPase subunit a
MAPLNFVGELGKGISHPFRLFGNIFGGFVILSVVGTLILQIGLPPLMNAFFGLFIGLIQAFVYAMLALAYIAVMITEE